MYWSLSGPASWLSVSLLGISCNPCADSTVKSNQLAGCDKNFMIEFFLDAISSSFFDFLQDSRLFISSKKHGRRELNSEEEQQLEGIPTHERHHHCETKVKLLPSKIVQEKASQKNKRYWTNGQNTALSWTFTRPMDSHQYWTVQTDTEDTTPSFTKK